MIKEIEVITINGHKYEIFHLPVMYNWNLYVEFMATVGDSFPGLFSAIRSLASSNQKNESINDVDIDLGQIGEGINRLFKSIHAKDPSGDMIFKILSQTTRDGVAINKNTIDGFFKGNMAEFMDVLEEACKLYFLDLLLMKKLFGNQNIKNKIAHETTES